MVGWTPQYLSKLLKGENFGMQPILTILEKFPEINARWVLFGTGEMLEIRKLFDLQHDTMMYIQSILDIDKYIPYMSGEEIHEFEDAVKTGRKPVFSPETIAKWEEQANDKSDELEARFATANNKSNELCKQRTARK
jgi:hypothetical protein